MSMEGVARTGAPQQMVSIFGQVTTADAALPDMSLAKDRWSPTRAPRAPGRGQGRIQVRHTVEVTIPAGVDDDVTLRLDRRADPDRAVDRPATLYLGFQGPSRIRRSSGMRPRDLLYELPVSSSAARRMMLGDTITITTSRRRRHPARGAVMGHAAGTARAGRMHWARRVLHVTQPAAVWRPASEAVRVVVPSHLPHHDRALYEQLGVLRTHARFEVKQRFSLAVRRVPGLSRRRTFTRYSIAKRTSRG